MSAPDGSLRVGTSGYHYDDWVGVLYPESLPRERWLERYAAEFDTVEINRTFYGLPDPDTVDTWAERVPADFLFALKFSRYGSHLKHLKDPADTIGNFLLVARRLGSRLGPILVQLPPRWEADPGRLRAFLDEAPGDLRWTVEVRDPRWLRGDVFAALREHGAALCIHDRIEEHPRELTARWTYLRYHGVDYAGSYAHQKLTADAGWIADRLAEGIDVYAYFNNDIGGCAVADASDLRRYAGTARV